MSGEPIFQRVAIIGLGLMGSSLARAIRRKWESTDIIGYDKSSDVRTIADELGFCNKIAPSAPSAVADADLVLLCVPVGAVEKIGEEISGHLKQGCVLSDTGSVKGSVVRALEPHIPEDVIFIPAHPVAGTEKSGPKAGSAKLFDKSYCILTPSAKINDSAFKMFKAFWKGCGAEVSVMDIEHHDMVLAITSHLPHFVAFGIVDAAAGLEQVRRAEVIKFSAGGLVDFTRIASSDVVMWWDIFLHNQKAILKMLDRFSANVDKLRNAIVHKDKKSLEKAIRHAQIIRQQIVKARQDKEMIIDYSVTHEKDAILEGQGIEYWVYQNWTVKRARIHTSWCSHCRANDYSKGRKNLDRNGRWHACSNYKEARETLGSFGYRDARNCHFCIGEQED